jgi:hypothetical protein
MSFEPKFRIHQKLKSGYEVFILGHQFDTTGPFHYFNDHVHAKNFCRYLFSLTQRHPANALTARNVVRTLSDDGSFWEEKLHDPTRQHGAFIQSRFPKRDAHQLLCDDGAYVGFAILTPKKHLISTFVYQGKDGPYIELGHFEMLRGDQADVSLVADMAERAETVTCFEQQQEPDEHTVLADLIVQRFSSRHIGGDPILTISHRDQLDHNQTYHIHRLLRISK